MFPERWEIAVVGGGAAGSVCAAILARAGARVVLLNAPGSRRSRVEVLSGRARWLLRDLDLPIPPGVELAETVSRWGSNPLLSRSAMFDPYGSGIAIERAALDGLLLDAAASSGAVIVAERVRSVSKNDVWEIDTRARRLTAGRMVFATGSVPGTFVRRRCEVVSRQTAFLCRSPETSAPKLWVEETSTGWWYALPVPAGGTFIGYCAERPPDRAGNGRWFQHALEETTIVSRRARAGPGGVWGVPAGVRTYDRAAGAGWCAIGDAAFTPDPLCGEGLWFACKTARLTADVLLGHESAGGYQEWVDRAVQSHLLGREEVRAC